MRSAAVKADASRAAGPATRSNAANGSHPAVAQVAHRKDHDDSGPLPLGAPMAVPQAVVSVSDAANAAIAGGGLSASRAPMTITQRRSVGLSARAAATAAVPIAAYASSGARLRQQHAVSHGAPVRAFVPTAWVQDATSQPQSHRVGEARSRASGSARRRSSGAPGRPLSAGRSTRSRASSARVGTASTGSAAGSPRSSMLSSRVTAVSASSLATDDAVRSSRSRSTSMSRATVRDSVKFRMLRHLLASSHSDRYSRRSRRRSSSKPRSRSRHLSGPRRAERSSSGTPSGAATSTTAKAPVFSDGYVDANDGAGSQRAESRPAARTEWQGARSATVGPEGGAGLAIVGAASDLPPVLEWSGPGGGFKIVQRRPNIPRGKTMTLGCQTMIMDGDSPRRAESSG